MASHVSIAVTGERDWKDRARVWDELDAILEPHTYDSVALYVGDCPTGADLFAREWWLEKHGESAIQIESDESLLQIWENVPGPDIYGEPEFFRNHMYVFVANWNKFGGYAGPERNGRLAKRFANDFGMQARAFWSGDRKRRQSSGTIDCMEQLAQNAIDVLAITSKKSPSTLAWGRGAQQ
jgi:hypothetical protein